MKIKIENCCRITKNTSSCKRKDGKIFNLPRRFSKKKCINGPVRGFTMSSSCAPYKFCKKRKISQKGVKIISNKENFINMNKQQLNLNGKVLQTCSINPMTGWKRSGKCEKSYNDRGSHTVCAKMDNQFLDYTKSQGNDLSSVVKLGQNWCLCENRWYQAYQDNKAPKVIRPATNKNIKDYIKEAIITTSNVPTIP